MIWTRRHGARWRRRAALLAVSLVVTAFLPPSLIAANAPPDTPVIVSPERTGVSPADVHMEMGTPFRDPNGDTHVASDWEIRAADGATVVWASHDSPVLVHAHLADGVFQGPLTGQRQLAHKTSYLFRVRFRDSSGAWSAWAERLFATQTQLQNPSREVQGVLVQPAPVWRADDGRLVALPAGARLTLETGASLPLLTLSGAGDGLVTTAGAHLPAPDLLRLRLGAPRSEALVVARSRLSVVSDRAERLTFYLPALSLAAGQEQILWVTQTGATFYGAAEQTHPSREQLARDSDRPWELEPGYRLEEAVATSFQLPTSLAFMPNPRSEPAAPRYYVTELHGSIKVVTNAGHVFTFAENLLNFRPAGEFPGGGESGVIGVCVPPDSSDVYATVAYMDEEALLRNKVIRVRSSDGLTATAVEDILVVHGDQGHARPSHQIQQCSFGPDGKLYVFMADGPNPATAQDDASFGGKVLRLNPDGSAPPDNPRYDPASPTAPISYQYTRGHRNAFGMAWRQAEGQLYLTENGPNVDRLVRVIPGQNYGWDGTNPSMRVRALYTWPEAHWSPVGLTFAEGPHATALPTDAQGHLFVASAGPVYAAGPQRVGKAIQEFRVAPDGAITAEPTRFARYVGEGRGSIADLKLQPDGLYFTDLYREDGRGGPSAPGGTIWRIRYTGQAAFTVSTRDGPAPLGVVFTDASTVTNALAWQWDFGDGASSMERSPTHTFGQPGRYAARLTVTGADGLQHESLALITVTDASTPG